MADTPTAPRTAVMPPSVGRIVHFVYGDQHCAALITDANYQVDRNPTDPHTGSYQALTVFPPMESPFTTVASLDPNGAPATWHWPEYVPAS
jgi:hypothetical protein